MVDVGEGDDAYKVNSAVDIFVGSYGADMVKYSFRYVVDMLSVFVVLGNFRGMIILI